MNETMTFILNLKENMKSGIHAIAAASHTDFGSVSRDIEQTQRHLNHLTDPVRLHVDTNGIANASREIEKVNNQVQNMHGNMSTSMGRLATGSFYGNLGAQGAIAAGQAIKQQFEETLTAGMDASRLMAEFNVMAGEKAGKTLMADLNKYIADTPFGTELYTDAKVLLSYGEAAKNIMPDIRMLGDISMGNAEKMHHLALAFGQTMASGKLAGGEMLQYIGAGFNPLQYMAEHTHGKQSVEHRYQELRKLMEDSKVTAEMVRGAFAGATSEGGLFHDMLKNIAETPSGQLDAMLGNIDVAKQGLGIQELPAIAQVLLELKPVIDELPATLQRLKPAIDEIIFGFADLVKWTRENTDRIGTFFGLIKIGVEAYAAWKIGTIAMAAANWLWVKSMGGVATETIAANGAIAIQNAELATQTELVAALALEYEALGASVSFVYGAERAAMLATAQASANVAFNPSIIGSNMLGIASNARSTIASGSIIGAVGSAVVPVAIAYFAGEALAQFISRDPITGRDWDLTRIAGANVNPQEQFLLGLSLGKMVGFDPIGDAERMAAARSDGAPWEFGLGGFKRIIEASKPDAFLQHMSKGNKSDNPFGDLPDGSAITGGGRKQIIINVKAFAEHFEVHAATLAEATGQTKEWFMKMFLEVLESANEAL